jgi:hypothetical protein
MMKFGTMPSFLLRRPASGKKNFLFAAVYFVVNLFNPVTPTMIKTCLLGRVACRQVFISHRCFSVLSETKISFEGVSENWSEQIYRHSVQPQTPVSLQTLMQTGRGEFLHKTYKDLDDTGGRGATEKVLQQVRPDIFRPPATTMVFHVCLGLSFNSHLSFESCLFSIGCWVSPP